MADEYMTSQVYGSTGQQLKTVYKTVSSCNHRKKTRYTLQRTGGAVSARKKPKTFCCTQDGMVLQIERPRLRLRETTTRLKVICTSSGTTFVDRDELGASKILHAAKHFAVHGELPAWKRRPSRCAHVSPFAGDINIYGRSFLRQTINRMWRTASRRCMGVVSLETNQSLKVALTAQENKGKLVVVDWTAAWCGPCKMISPVLEELSETHSDALFLKADVDELQEAAVASGIQSMPTFQFIRDGTLLDEFSGADPDLLKEFIEKYK